MPGRIIDACQAQGIEAPVWRSDGGFVTITFKRPDFKSGTIADDEKERDVIQKTDVEEYPSSTPQAPLKHPLSTPQVELLIQKMSDSYMSMREMAEVCNIKDLKYFRESYITPALESGMIERLYPNHPKHPKQQYQLTTAAKEWIKKNTK